MAIYGKKSAHTAIEKAASSKSIQKSITELEALLLNRKFPISRGPLRTAYHQMLSELLADVAAGWYRRGFRRCHKTLYEQAYTKRKKVSAERQMKAVYLPGGALKVKLKSSV